MSKARFLTLAGCLGLAFLGSLGGAQAGAYGPDECKPGYVWREARPGDTVCVTPAERARVKRENRTQERRREAGGGAYGPKTCKQGYVWREAFVGDTVCVTPQERRRAKMNNAERDGKYKY